MGEAYRRGDVNRAHYCAATFQPGAGAGRRCWAAVLGGGHRTFRQREEQTEAAGPRDRGLCPRTGPGAY
jgi:hypothetical protein